MKKAIIFDLEGTLVKMDRQHYIVDFALKENGVCLDVPKIYKVRGFNKYSVSEVFFKVLIAIHKFNLENSNFLEENTQKIIDDCLEKLNSENLILAKKVREEYQKLRYGNMDKKDKLYPDAIKTLEALSKDYLLGIYTARKKESAKKVLRDLNIEKYFNFVLGEETKRSPNPSLKLIEKCEELNISIKESFLIGDAEFDIMHGKGAGLKTIMVFTGNASLALAKQANPKYTINKLSDLLCLDRLVIS